MIISISGKKGSGKDTVANIIKYLTEFGDIQDGPAFNDCEEFGGDMVTLNHGKWQTKAWADALKEMTALLLGVPVEKFNDREFKNSELPENWWYYTATVPMFRDGFPAGLIELPDRYSTKEDAIATTSWVQFIHEDHITVNLHKPTVRELLQNLGTEVGRQIHPNVWINVLMFDYVRSTKYTKGVGNPDGSIEPNWIITDTRFPDEYQAVVSQGGLNIRIERLVENRQPALWEEFEHGNHGIDDWEDFLRHKGKYDEIYHISETKLDDYKEWDYVIYNDGSMEDLIVEVEKFLEQYKKLLA